MIRKFKELAHCQARDALYVLGRIDIEEMRRSDITILNLGKRAGVATGLDRLIGRVEGSYSTQSAIVIFKVTDAGIAVADYLYRNIQAVPYGRYPYRQATSQRDIMCIDGTLFANNGTSSDYEISRAEWDANFDRASYAVVPSVPNVTKIPGVFTATIKSPLMAFDGRDFFFEIAETATRHAIYRLDRSNGDVTRVFQLDANDTYAHAYFDVISNPPVFHAESTSTSTFATYQVTKDGSATANVARALVSTTSWLCRI
ncbi:hypothetical protein BC374_17660 [Ensifer sp. LC13]|nr:hypothetical protein BC362_10305 [Ensifer sp. LC14]OCP10897.1 hypothetical protein BC374_17660 [Ensifer sp. LC13]OCP11557.1 hypothetical protein BBX50_18195 [Ensifer sp. LC11]OCP33376.1 hypothetical protein BC364_17085 [Ensifer sp. LC499]